MRPTKRPLAKSGKRKKIITENFSDEEWKSFDCGKALPAEKSEEMHRYVLNKIAERTEIREHRKLKLIQVARYLSAAAIIVLIGITLLLGRRESSRANKPDLLGANEKPRKTTLESIWKEVKNSSNAIKTIRLPDSSLVMMYPKSTLRFDQQFKSKFRDLYLMGKAKFKVKPDKTRPFSVFAGDLKTTALGTSFTINTSALSHRVSVKLHTGKIVVSNTSSPQPPNYISSVGTVLIYDGIHKLSKIIKTVPVTKTIPEFLNHEGSLITMKNIPLKKVIGLLNDAYRIKINFTNADINRITYTGMVNVEKEQAEQVLNDICLINNMTLIKVSPEEFTIQKSNK